MPSLSFIRRINLTKPTALIEALTILAMYIVLYPYEVHIIPVFGYSDLRAVSDVHLFIRALNFPSTLLIHTTYTRCDRNMDRM